MTSDKKTQSKTAQTATAGRVNPTPSASATASAGAGTVAKVGATAAAPVTGAMLIDVPLAQVKQAVAQAMTALGTIRSLLPNPTRLTTAQRKEIAGRMRTGESAVLENIAVVAQMPAYATFVASLADLDYGVNPNVFEAPLLSQRLQAADALGPLSDALTSLGEDLSDTALQLNALGRPPLLEAYAILKSVAKTNPALMALIKDAINFYAAPAQAAAKARAAKKAAAATPTTTGKAAG